MCKCVNTGLLVLPNKCDVGSPQQLQSGKVCFHIAPAAWAPRCPSTESTNPEGSWGVWWPHAHSLQPVWIWRQMCNSMAWSSLGNGPPWHCHHI